MTSINSSIPKIRCILYSEFDDVKGPKIICQSPARHFNPAQCDVISSYILTGFETRETIIIFTTETGMKLMGFPVHLRNVSKYNRSKLLFNICFVFNATSSSSLQMFKPIVRKVGLFAKKLETQSSFLSDPTNKIRLQQTIKKIKANLNERQGHFGHFLIPKTRTANRSEATAASSPQMFFLKLFPDQHRRFTDQVAAHHVPVLTRRPEEVKAALRRTRVSLVLKRILPMMDGCRFAKQIAIDMDVQLDCVLHALRQLLYYGCICIVDMFQYTNIYRVTSRIKELYSSSQLQQQCMRYLSGKGAELLNARVVMRCYALFQRGAMVQDVCSRVQPALAKNMQALVRFGTFRGLLRRVHRFPILRQTKSSLSSTEIDKNRRALRAMLAPPSLGFGDKNVIVPSRRITYVHLKQRTEWPHALSDDVICCRLMQPLHSFLEFLEEDCDVVLK